MGVRIIMAAQDITAWVDELSRDIESNLGQDCSGVPLVALTGESRTPRLVFIAVRWCPLVAEFSAFWHICSLS
ncbi:MAG: hypothetical protein ACLQUY_09340 [Ktedonobacterales bacterium]